MSRKLPGFSLTFSAVFVCPAENVYSYDDTPQIPSLPVAHQLNRAALVCFKSDHLKLSEFSVFEVHKLISGY